MITHQTVKRGKVVSADYTDEVGNKIDYVAELSGCPYSFPAGTWTFVKTGDDMTQVKTRDGVVFTRRQIYSGFKGVDKNFYGEYLNGTSFVHNRDNIISGRWEIEGL